LTGTLAASVCAALLLAAAGCGDRASKSPSDKVIALLPPDTGVLVALSVSAFDGSSALASIEEDLRKTQGLGDVLRDSNVRLAESVRSLYVAIPSSVNPTDADAPSQVVAVLVTDLPDGFLSDVMERSDHSFRREAFGKYEGWVSPDDPDRVAIVALRKGVIAFGAHDAVTAVVERDQKKASGLTRKSPLFAEAGDVNRDAAMWGVVNVSGPIAEEAQKNPMTSGFGAVHHLVWDGDYTASQGLRFRLSAVCDSETSAAQVKSSIETLIGLASLGGKIDPLILEFLDDVSIEVARDRALLTATVPPETLDRLIRRRGADEKATPPASPESTP